jgi:hypothetical protein
LTLTFLDATLTAILIGGTSIQKIQRLFIIALFGAIIFVSNVFLPAPLNYLLIVVQAVLLALSALFIPKIGAMSVGGVGGLLTALISGTALGPFTFFFAFLFGVFVDVFLLIFKIKGSNQIVSRNKMMAAMAVSTFLIAVSSYLAFTTGFFYISLFVQRSTMLDALVLFMGPVTGAVAGYATSYLWNKYLRHISV